MNARRRVIAVAAAVGVAIAPLAIGATIVGGVLVAGAAAVLAGSRRETAA